jgi:hypothetical protein
VAEAGARSAGPEKSNVEPNQSPRFVGPARGRLVHHTDAEREWAYDRKSSIGKLDKAWDEATQRGWTVVDMKQDWRTIYPFQKQ